MCSPAGVCLQYGEDVERVFGIPKVYGVPGPGGVFLGSVGDQAHATRKSSHNCAPMQEDPVDGVAYHPGFAHAWDARPATKAIGEAMRAATLADRRCRYVLYDNKGTKPNGETWTLDHPTFHVSFLPGTHDDLTPFFTDQQEEFTVAEIDRMVEAQNRTTTAVRRQGLLNRQSRANNTKRIIEALNGNTEEVEKELRDIEAEIKKLPQDDG